ncbi:OmpA family protein, partial [Belliella aquatica]
PIPYGKMLAIDTVYYDFDKYNIRPDAAEVLDRASEVLAAYPDFNLNITSHTDARASNAYNERLSQNRSNSAANYLKGTGVVGERLSTAWKGEQEPVNPCVEGVDCPESMHDRNRRSILSLELYPDLDGDYSLPGGLSYVKSTDELMEAIASMVREKQASLLPLILAEDMVYYDLDKYEIRPDASKVLKAAEDLLKKYPFLKLEIASHTDSRQTLLYNDRLSKNRSMAVFFHL